MKHSDLNHLRRLIGWVSCEIGQTPEELVATVQNIAAKLGPVDIADEGKQRLVEAHDKARSTPKYVRDALKALRKATAAIDEVVEPAKDARFGPFAMVLRDVAELDHAPPDADAADLLMVLPDELRLIMERHLSEPEPTNPFAIKQVINERNAALDMVRKVETLNADLMEKIEELQARPAAPQGNPVPITNNWPKSKRLGKDFLVMLERHRPGFDAMWRYEVGAGNPPPKYARGYAFMGWWTAMESAAYLPAPAAPVAIPTVEELIEIIGEHLTSVYVCGRVWDAWNIGTMSQDDFTEAGETEFPGDVATAIHARLLAQPARHELHREDLTRWRLSFERYEKARKLSPAQWAALHKRNLAGEWFDGMVDALAPAVAAKGATQ